jgi:glycosyltransferase involved in cell wall biosynthesis
MSEAVDVLLLSTYDTDGAGKFTHMLAGAFRRLGMTTRVVCVRSRSGEAGTYGLIDRHPVRQAAYRLAEEFDRRILRPRSEYAFIHLRGLPDRAALNAEVWPERCRLIVCTFLSGMMSTAAVLALRSRYGNPPVIFYGVDMNFYTGGCHYARDCTGYQKDCSSCPAVPALVRPAVRKAFDAKRECYRRIAGHVVVSSSNDHHQQIVSSALFRHSDVRRMLMSVDGVFYGQFEQTREELKQARGLSARILLLRSSSEPRKGCDMFAEAMRMLGHRSPGALKDLIVVAIGDQHVAQLLGDVGVRVHSPGFIQDVSELARLYAMADFFVNPSLADGGPVMLAEALMSGTPVITTDVGLARDLVHAPSNGFIIDRPCAEELAAAIGEFCTKSDADLGQMRREARRLALDQIGEESYLKGLSALVEELIGAH